MVAAIVIGVIAGVAVYGAITVSNLSERVQHLEHRVSALEHDRYDEEEDDE